MGVASSCSSAPGVCILWQNNFYDAICDVTVVKLQEDKVFRTINE